jgi:PAS domain S-box-containing protein
MKADADADGYAGLVRDLVSMRDRRRTHGVDPDVVDDLLNRAAEALSELTAANASADGARYRSLFDHAPDAYLITNLDGVIVEANDGAERLLAQRADFLVHKPLAVFVDIDWRRDFTELILRAASRAELVQTQILLRARRGLPIPVDARVIRVGIVDEDPVLQWMLRDLSDYKRSEFEIRTLNDQLEVRVEERTAELQAANEQLAVIVKQLPVAVIVVDIDGRTTLVNAEAEELIGRAGLDPASPLAYLELRFQDLLGEPVPAHQRPLRFAIAEGTETSGRRVNLELADGSVRLLELSAAPIRDASETIIGGVAVTVDVTEREMREQAEREFVTNAAHQLRTPLAAIKSSVEVLQAGAKDDPVTRDRFLEHLEREGERATRLVRTLLVLARAQAAVEDPRHEIVDVGAILADVAHRLGSIDGVKIEVKCPHGTAAVTNSELLGEALLCLADNAVRHAGSERVLLEARPENGTLAVEVIDEGKGIPPEIRERMLARFFHGGTGKGFGLGLAIAAEAAKAAGGQLEIDSEPGRGTAARITLPPARMLTS